MKGLVSQSRELLVQIQKSKQVLYSSWLRVVRRNTYVNIGESKIE